MSIHQERIGSIGELEGRIAYTKADYESHRAELNAIIEEHNKLSSLLEQANTYYRLAKQESLTEAEQLQKTVCRKAMDSGVVVKFDGQSSG